MEQKISISVNVEKNSCLSSNVVLNKKHLIDELTIIGYYSSELDGEYLRSMCNSIDENGHRTGGRLSKIDFSKAQIRSARQPNCNTEDMKGNDFQNCITLKEVVLSELNNFNAQVFSGCVSLESIGYAGEKCFKSIKGILYQVGKWKCLSSDYGSFPSDNKILVKFPSAKQNTKDIDFKNITAINDYAFEDFCGSDLYMPMIPPTLTSKAFYNVDISRIIIHVPQGAFNSYWSHPIWQDFQITEDNAL